MQERVRVGAAQVAPHFFDRQKTLEKTLRLIQEAGQLGLDLLVFPETYFAAYPFWRGSVSVRRSTELVVEMQRHAIREYAIENQAFVVSSSWCLKPEDVPADLRDEMRYNLAVGGSCIVNPAGLYLKGPVFNQETIVWAEIDAEDRRLAKAYFDCLGHYARFDLLTLSIREEAWSPTGPRGAIPAASVPLPDVDLRKLANRHGLRLEELEAFLARGVDHAE